MNRFLNEFAKAVLCVIAIIGVILIAAGIVLLICPAALRWGIVLTCILAGIYFIGCALYGIIKAKTP